MMRSALLVGTFAFCACSHAAPPPTGPQPPSGLANTPPATAPATPGDKLAAFVGAWKSVDPSAPELLTIQADGTFDWKITKSNGDHCTIAGKVAYAEVVPGAGDGDGDDDDSGGYDGDEGGGNPCGDGAGETALNLPEMRKQAAGGVGSLAPPPAAGGARPQLQWTMTTNDCNSAYQGRTTGDWVAHVDADHLGLSDADPAVSNHDVVEYTKQR